MVKNKQEKTFKKGENLRFLTFLGKEEKVSFVLFLFCLSIEARPTKPSTCPIGDEKKAFNLHWQTFSSSRFGVWPRPRRMSTRFLTFFSRSFFWVAQNTIESLPLRNTFGDIVRAIATVFFLLLFCCCKVKPVKSHKGKVQYWWITYFPCGTQQCGAEKLFFFFAVYLKCLDIETRLNM